MANPGKLVLVVDDQPEMRKTIGRILKIAGFDVTEAEDGQKALETLAALPVEMIISDLRMPGMDGIELLHQVRKQKSVPFVLMTGFAEIIESAEAYAMGVDGFMLKPFKQEELLAAVREAADSRRNMADKAKETGDEIQIDKFCGIPVEEFVSGREIHFPIFMKLSETKFVRIAYAGEDLSPEKIKNLQGKGIKFLYLQREDFKQYVSFASRVANVIMSSKAVTPSAKAKFLRHSTETLLEFGFQQYVDKEIYEAALTSVQQSLSLLSDNSMLLEMLESLSSLSTPLYAHSMGVAMIASLISKALGWESSHLNFRVASGALLHDLGKRDFSEELLKKPPKMRTTEEEALWREHPRIGADLLSKVEDMPMEVVQIVLHHHEVADGTGYPLGLKSVKIHPVAKVVSMADEFVKWYKGEPGFGSGIAPHLAVKELEKRNDTGGVPSLRWEHLATLQKIFPEK
jgi:putative nucleotidyltransferase with HDIG domain